MEPYWRVSIQGHCASLRLSRLVFGVPAENCCPPSNELSLSRGEIRLLTRSNASLRRIEHQEGVCMASMKKEEARQAVLGEYDRWAKKHPDDATMMGGFLFFRYLQNERTELLDFRASDNDKSQIVHGWLRDWVKD
jgi:hypothetical protein